VKSVSGLNRTGGLGQGASAVLRYAKYVLTTLTGLWPSRRGREVANRSYVVSLDAWSPIPAVTCSELLGDKPLDSDWSIHLLPGTQGGGSVNVFESFLLSSLVRLVAPRAIVEVGTFRGGTTWHLFENAPPGAIIYTFDLPPGAGPDDLTDPDLAAPGSREFLPQSPRVQLRLIDTRTWDGALESKVQFAFIDGNHTYDGVRNDTEKVFRLLDEDACVCWHDCLGREYGYGVHRYLVGLCTRGFRVFRVRGVHEISSLAIWMTPALERRLGFTAPAFR
jgi:hypothetical protein